MRSPYSSIDASREESNETVEIQRVGISRRKSASTDIGVTYEFSREDL